MKTLHVLFAIAGASALTLAGCGNRQEAAENRAQANTPMAAPDGRAAASDILVAPTVGEAGNVVDRVAASERAALGVLNAINDHEIAAAQMALGMNVNGAAADYANHMIEEHTTSRVQTQALNPDSASAEAQEQARKGKMKRDALAGEPEDHFARAYLAAMVTDHTEALAALDDRLIPAATTPAVMAHLQATRDHVAQHLERARELQMAF